MESKWDINANPTEVLAKLKIETDVISVMSRKRTFSSDSTNMSETPHHKRDQKWVDSIISGTLDLFISTLLSCLRGVGGVHLIWRVDRYMRL